MTKLLQNKKPRRERDNYPTPAPIAEWVVKHCLEMVGPPNWYKFLEPGCGDNAPFASAFSKINLGIKKEIDLTDIRDVAPPVATGKFTQMDFIGPSDQLFPLLPPYNIVATNPPFNQAIHFWRRSMEMLYPSGVLGLVTKLSFLATKNRSEIWETQPPAEVHVFYPRPSFTGDGCTDIGQEYCAAFWYRPEFAKFICRSPLTTMSWVNLKEITGAQKCLNQ